MPLPPGQGIIKVVDVDAYIRSIRDPRTGYIFPVTFIALKLEDGRVFTMSNIPGEIVEAINVYKNNIETPRRQSVYILLMDNEYFREKLSEIIKEVVIDEIDRESGVYTASLVLEGEGINFTIKMIPSHAVFLALITGKPIYVKEELVDEAATEDFEEF